MRNGAVYVIQGNRNPFVDHPEFVTPIYDSNAVAGVDERAGGGDDPPAPNLPNPFSARTTTIALRPARGASGSRCASTT